MTRPDQETAGGPGRMRSTSLATLFATMLAATGVAWLFIDRFYAVMPDLPWLPPLTIAALAFVETIAAWQTKARIDRRHGTAPVEPLLVVRYVVLAKASALTGALFLGAYLGLASWLFVQRGALAHAAQDLPPALSGLGAALMLVAAGLWLERACRVPQPPPGHDHPDRVDS